MKITSEMLPGLNTATKYPSIPTYHTLDPKNGDLLEEAVQFRHDTVLLTEKVDGTNVRLIFMGGHWFIGSREELLTHGGDLVPNTKLGIVEALAPLCEEIAKSGYVSPRGANTWGTVIYLELYGLKSLPAWKTYSDGTPAWRMFDVTMVPENVLTMGKEEASRWRELEGFRFYWPERDLRSMSAEIKVPLTPRLESGPGNDLPQSVEAMSLFLKSFRGTKVAVGDVTPGNSEGLVLRTQDRRTIAKARFQDYERTLNRRLKK